MSTNHEENNSNSSGNGSNSVETRQLRRQQAANRFVQTFFTSYKVEWTGPACIRSKTNKQLQNTEQVLRRFHAYIYELDRVGAATPKTYWDDLFFEAIDGLRLNALEAINNHLAYRKKESGGDALYIFVQALTGRADKTDIAVMQQLLWQIKRKMLQRQVDWHVMPIIRGPQGVGKSRALERLLAPIKNLVIKGKSVDFVTDERQFRALSEHYCVVFDEMARASKADIEHLKNIISSSAITARPLYTNATVQYEQNCTFIGSTNTPVHALFNDATGMRRFYEILCMEKCDWGKLEQMDMVEVWRAVDEGQEQAYTATEDVWASMTPRQEELRAQDAIEQFIKEIHLEAIKEGEAEPVPLSTLFSLFKAFCEEANILNTPTRLSFDRRLQDFHFKKVIDPNRNKPAAFLVKLKNKGLPFSSKGLY